MSLLCNSGHYIQYESAVFFPDTKECYYELLDDNYWSAEAKKNVKIDPKKAPKPFFFLTFISGQLTILFSIPPPLFSHFNKKKNHGKLNLALMLVPFTCNSGYLNTGGFLESVRSANCVCRGISEEIKSVYTEQTFFMNPSVSNNRIDYVEFEAKLLYLCTGAAT